MLVKPFREEGLFRAQKQSNQFYFYLRYGNVQENITPVLITMKKQESTSNGFETMSGAIGVSE